MHSAVPVIVAICETCCRADMLYMHVNMLSHMQCYLFSCWYFSSTCDCGLAILDPPVTGRRQAKMIIAKLKRLLLQFHRMKTNRLSNYYLEEQQMLHTINYNVSLCQVLLRMFYS